MVLQAVDGPLVFCVQCGAGMASEAAFCGQCGTPAPGGAPPAPSPSPTPSPTPSSQPIHWGWWSLPVFFSWLGGLIAYFVLRDRNKRTATAMMITGFVMVFVWSVLVVMLATAYVFWSSGGEFPSDEPNISLAQGVCDPASSATAGRVGFTVVSVSPGFAAGDLLAYDAERGPGPGDYFIVGASSEMVAGDFLTLSPGPGATITCAETVIFEHAGNGFVVAVADLHP